MMTLKEIECCRMIGRDEANRVTTIGLAELDALCDTATMTAVAYRRGQEAMRELAARYSEGTCKSCYVKDDGRGAFELGPKGREIAKGIRALEVQQ